MLFSAYAEVFLREDAEGNSRRPFLCLRRGVSPCRPSLWESLPLFSAYAEVFLTKQKHSGFIRAFLCLRRGVSLDLSGALETRVFSLPTQRCFRHFDSSVRPYLLFSAYAEVFLRIPSGFGDRLAFLCLRRGVSACTRPSLADAAFSLPTQRCFLPLREVWLIPRLFSAYAEVFLTSRNPLSRWTHFSLPTQRCFSLEISPPVLCRLFSAYAEVFLLRA